MSWAKNVRDVLGWSRPFRTEVLSAPVFAALREAGVLESCDGGWRSMVRVSSLDGQLFLHAAYPPSADDAVFFGPDTYRFANFLQRELSSGPAVERLIDIGTGSGAGAVVAAKAARCDQIIGCDVNPTALRIAAVNVQAAGLQGDFREGEGLAPAPELADLIIANPPFIAGSGGRTYRDGGDMLGARLSLDWALAAARQLTEGGRFLLYTGSAIVDGVDGLEAALQAQLDKDVFALRYRELDPDIFGGQLATEAYRHVERIAAVGAVITRRFLGD